ncbi:hypothetical protein [Streptomyces sp. CB03234]|uniref:hypothetical protein n=1 Tax=Streptomyces sp. (strain CB03234) TaxID=1703937 RepID=UPI001F51BD8E|nr:hypothetical protein [Streptomyces sp. CB03234]
MGVRHFGDETDFVAVRSGRPVLCVELRRRAPFSRLAVSDPDPAQTMRHLRPLVPRERLG